MQTETVAQSLNIPAADIQIRAQLLDQALTIDIMKSGARVHRVTLNGALSHIDHGWLADLFANEHKVELGAMAGDMHDYVDGLNINQG